MSESEFYYRSMLQANEWRRDEFHAPSYQLLMDLTSSVLTSIPKTRDVYQEEAHCAELVKLAAMAMRIAITRK